MKGMKKTNREFQTSYTCLMPSDVQKVNGTCRVDNAMQDISNMCVAPKVKIKRNKEDVMEALIGSARHIFSILIMLSGICTIVLALAELYIMSYESSYSQYIFLSLEGATSMLVAGIWLAIYGLVRILDSEND